MQTLSRMYPDTKENHWTKFEILAILLSFFSKIQLKSSPCKMPIRSNWTKMLGEKCGALQHYRARGSKAGVRKGGAGAAAHYIVSPEYIQQLKTTMLVQYYIIYEVST